MTNALTLFQNNALPAHLAALGETENILPRDTTPALTFRGKTWRLRQGGEEIVLTRKNTDGETEPAPMVKLVVLNMNQRRSRIFYAKGFEEGKNQSPSCWSSDGEKPDANVPQTQKCAATCASCPNSVKGSKITDNGKETTACAPLKRVAVIPAGKLDMDPLLLKIPQTSLWDKSNEEANAQGWFAWDQYVDFLRQRGVKHTAAVVTKVKFDFAVAYPKLLFTAERWLEADEVTKILPLVTGDAVQKLLSGQIHEGGADEPAEPAAQAPAPAPAAAPVASPAPVAAPAPAPAPAPATPPLSARPAAPDDDDGDAFANVGAAAPAATPAAPVAAATPAKAPAPPKPPKTVAATPAAPPQPPAPPKPATAAPSAELAQLAAAWDD